VVRHRTLRVERGERAAAVARPALGGPRVHGGAAGSDWHPLATRDPGGPGTSRVYAPPRLGPDSLRLMSDGVAGAVPEFDPLPIVEGQAAGSRAATAKTAMAMLTEGDSTFRAPTPTQRRTLAMAFASVEKIIYGKAFDAVARGRVCAAYPAERRGFMSPHMKGQRPTTRTPGGRKARSNPRLQPAAPAGGSTVDQMSECSFPAPRPAGRLDLGSQDLRCEDRPRGRPPRDLGALRRRYGDGGHH
jgi:hypothetical protein